MSPDVLRRMGVLVDRWQGPARVLDVGALDVNGTYRPLIEGRGWEYTGLDIVAGPNVDVVAENPYGYPFDAGSFDVVISGATMEHVRAVWLWMEELARVLRPGGMLALITHTCWEYHRFPVDCWRIMPDGMEFLLDWTGRLRDYEIEMWNDTHISAVAWRI